MTARLIIKSETYDPDLALEIVRDQRSKPDISAWIEDEHGNVVDEESLKTTGREPIKPTLSDRFMGPLVVMGSILAGLVILYFASFWIEP